MSSHITSHSRQETREGQQRPINKDYYYIDFHATIDAIKYRIFNLTKKVEDMYTPSEEKKDFHCPRCKAQYTTFEVLHNNDPTGLGFICDRCSGILEYDERAAGDGTGHEKQSKLMGQLEFLLKLLQQIDTQDIPSNTFETAFAVAVPVKRNEDTNPLRATAPLEAGKVPPTAVKGLAQTVLQPLEISVTTSSERTAAEQAAEATRKAEIAAQNVLPVWHTASTVTGESTVYVGGKNGRDAVVNGGGAGLVKAEEMEEKKVGTTMADELTAYYAQMQKEKEKEKEAREDREADEEEDEDDDEDEFEDVGLGAKGAGTPQSSISNTNLNGMKSALTNGGIKRELDSEPGSSAPVTGTSTPVLSQQVVEDDEPGPAAKKVKFGANGGRAEDGPVEGEKDSDEDEDGAEFEDAL